MKLCFGLFRMVTSSIYFAVRVQVKNHISIALLLAALPSLPISLADLWEPSRPGEKMAKEVTGS